MNASATEVRIAYRTMPTKLAAIRPISLGRSSKKMIRHGRSPNSRAARDVVAVAQRQGLRADHARAPRPAEHAQHDRRRQSPACGRKPRSTISSGSAGNTRKTLVSSDSPSSAAAAEVAGGDADGHRRGGWRSTPASRPSTTVERVPTSNWERTSWPVAVVPSRCVRSAASGSA